MDAVFDSVACRVILEHEGREQVAWGKSWLTFPLDFVITVLLSSGGQGCVVGGFYRGNRSNNSTPELLSSGVWGSNLICPTSYSSWNERKSVGVAFTA